MNYLAAWIQTPFAQSLGWTLLHFLWEGGVLAVILMAMLRLFREQGARLRYGLACVILAAMPLVFAATLAVMWSRQPAPIHWRPLAISSPILPVAEPLPTAPAPRFTLDAMLDRLPWLVPLWFLGVVFFYARGVAGWAAARRLRRRGVCAAAPAWQARLDGIAARMRLSRPVALLESCFTDTPVLIGYLRPVILVPLGCLAGLSAAQVECILLHELAHIARRDYLVNLLQSAVEGLLFYHPAVWWTSRVVRAERENCCDDCVVELTGDARSYAATLAALEQRRALAPQAALLAATGGNLMKRIQRLTKDSRGPQASAVPVVSAGLLLVVFAAGLAAVPAKFPAARHRRTEARLDGVALAAAAPATAAIAQEQDAGIAGSYLKWLHQDVAYIITDAERAGFLALTTDAQRDEFIEAFWTRRDPTPDTVENEFKEEHYRRFTYANAHFGASVAGWKTDRGRIYITYGPPDEIEDHSAAEVHQRLQEQGGGATSTYPFQKWQYRHMDRIGDNVIIEFVDSQGSGDYRMTMDPNEKEALVERQAQPPAANVAGNHAALRAKSAAPPEGRLPEAAYVITEEERAAFQRLQTSAAAKPQPTASSQSLDVPYRTWLNKDVAYIITDEERSAFLRLGSDAERENFIASFWKRRDPTPDTWVNEFKEEHYRRFAYSNDHFSTGIPGWKTDRGRIYIVYGPPDAVTDNRPKSVTWTYRFIEGVGSDVQVQFEDPNGDGEFRLSDNVSPGLMGPPKLAR